jgi:uncharacterized protein YkwD
VFKRRATLIVAGLTLGCFSFIPSTPAHAGSSKQDRVERAVFHQLNSIRAQNGLRPLRRSRGLARAADVKAREVTRTQILSHDSPNGTSMQSRVRKYVKARTVGETIGYVPARSRQANAIVDAWMASPSHRQALLSPAFRRMGVGRRKGSMGASRVAVIAVDLASSK